MHLCSLLAAVLATASAAPANPSGLAVEFGSSSITVTGATPGGAAVLARTRSSCSDKRPLAHRPGTLIGKALEPRAEGDGEILVLAVDAVARQDCAGTHFCVASAEEGR